MFSTDYTFYGKHADYAKSLVGIDGIINFGGSKGLIEHGYDLLLIAPIIGVSYNIKSKKDDSNKQAFSIKAIQIIRIKERLESVFKLVILSEKDRGLTEDEKIDKIFRNFEKDELQEEIEIFDQYLLGGLEWLYRNLIEGARSEHDYIDNMKKIIDEYSMDFSLVHDSLIKEPLEIYGDEII